MKLLSAFLFCAALALGPAQAAEPLSPEEKAAVAQAEAWLNEIQTFKADFLQASSVGGTARGQIYIRRPGRMLIEYAAPAQLEVYADGQWLIYVDHELKETNQVPLSLTPARFLVEKNVKLEEEADIRVHRSAASFQLHLTRKENPEEGRMTLIFSASPVSLLAWSIRDTQRVETTINLLNSHINVPVDKKKVIYAPPDWAFQ